MPTLSSTVMISVSRRYASLWIALMVLCATASADSIRHQQIPFDSANVSSDDGEAFAISWRAPGVGHVQVYAGTDPAEIGRAHPVGEGGSVGRVTISSLPKAARWYFELVPDRGTVLVIADRSLHLSTAANFRDAGGYRTETGQWVRSGLIYRSNGLEHLSDDELAHIEGLNIKLVCDLRTREEIGRGADRVPKHAEDISTDVLADDADLIHALLTGAGPKTDGETRELEIRIYRDFVKTEGARKAYRALFKRLADPSDLPTVFHCTAGKDRTGWAQATLLTMLGVPRATIIQDYVLTNECLQGAALNSVRQSIKMGDNQRPVVANPAALEAAFDEVIKDYGSFVNYLRHGLQLDAATIDAIKANFLIG